jgi:hypothetical protein
MTGINGMQSGQESTETEMRQGEALDRRTKFAVPSPRSSTAYWTSDSVPLCDTKWTIDVKLVDNMESAEQDAYRFMSTGRKLPFHIRPGQTLRRHPPRH